MHSVAHRSARGHPVATVRLNTLLIVALSRCDSCNDVDLMSSDSGSAARPRSDDGLLGMT